MNLSTLYLAGLNRLLTVKLKQAINIPERIRDIGDREDQFPRFATKS